MKYDLKTIEPKWQQKWDEAVISKSVDVADKPKFCGIV